MLQSMFKACTDTLGPKLILHTGPFQILMYTTGGSRVQLVDSLVNEVVHQSVGPVTESSPWRSAEAEVNVVASSEMTLSTHFE